MSAPSSPLAQSPLRAPAGAQKKSLAGRAAVRVVPADTGTRVVDPGTVVSVAFRVASEHPAPLRITTTLSLPAGWRSVGEMAPLVLQPNSTVVRIASLWIARDAPAGPVDARLVANATEIAEASAGIVRLEVRERRELLVRLIDAPPYVPVGESYVARFLVTNAGNVATRARVRMRSAPMFEVASDSAIALQAGESRTIAVQVSTRQVPATASHHALTVYAQLIGATGALGEPAVASSRVPLLRRGDVMNETHHYRSTIEMTMADSSSGGFGFEMSGSGTLDAEGRTQLDYLARLPQQMQSQLGDQDEYRARLKGSGYELIAGDNVFSLSPLTQSGRYAFGGSARITAGVLEAGLFTSQPRRRVEPWKEYGGTVELQPAPRLRFGINYLTTDGSQHGVSSIRRVWSVRTAIPLPLPGDARLEVERGRSALPRDPSAAWMWQLNGQGRRFSYAVQWIAADSAFGGVFSGSDLRFASVSFRPWEALQLGGRIRDELRSGLSSFVGATASDFSERVASLDIFRLLRFEAREAWWSGALPGGRFDRAEQSAKAQLSPRGRGLALDLSAELGHSHDSRSSTPQLMQRYRAAINASLGSVALSPYVERLTGPTLYESEVHERTMAGVSGSIGLGYRARVEFSAFGNRDLKLASGSNLASAGAPPARAVAFEGGVIEGQLEYLLPAGHRVAARGRAIVRRGATRVQNPGWQLRYSLPLAVPIRSSGTTGDLRLVLVDQATGRGVPDVVVRIDERMLVTDARGRLALSGLAPKEYFLSIATRSGDRLVPSEPSATIVQVEPGRTTTRHVRLVRGARIVGAVRAYVRAGASRDTVASALSDSGGVHGVLVSLGGERDTLRRITNADGAFEFNHLPPGRWTLIADAQSLGGTHRLESSTLVLAVAPGERLDVLLRAVPRVQQIQMIDGGRVDRAPAAAGATLPRRPRRGG